MRYAHEHVCTFLIKSGTYGFVIVDKWLNIKLVALSFLSNPLALVKTVSEMKMLELYIHYLMSTHALNDNDIQIQ